jgi:hypothetical protein
VASLKLEGFRQEWNAELVQQQNGTFVFWISVPPLFWERLIGRSVGLEIHVQLSPPVRAGQPVCDVSVRIQPFGCSRARATRLLAELGPKLLASLRGYLQALPDKRTQERVAWQQPLRVSPVINGTLAPEPIECVAKDISQDGIGLYLPSSVKASHLYVALPSLPQFAGVAGLVRIVRRRPHDEEWYEVGARFATADG